MYKRLVKIHLLTYVRHPLNLRAGGHGVREVVSIGQPGQAVRPDVRVNLLYYTLLHVGIPMCNGLQGRDR